MSQEFFSEKNLFLQKTISSPMSYHSVFYQSMQKKQVKMKAVFSNCELQMGEEVFLFAKAMEEYQFQYFQKDVYTKQELNRLLTLMDTACNLSVEEQKIMETVLEIGSNWWAYGVFDFQYQEVYRILNSTPAQLYQYKMKKKVLKKENERFKQLLKSMIRIMLLSYGEFTSTAFDLEHLAQLCGMDPQVFKNINYLEQVKITRTGVLIFWKDQQEVLYSHPLEQHYEDAFQNAEQFCKQLWTLYQESRIPFKQEDLQFRRKVCFIVNRGRALGYPIPEELEDELFQLQILEKSASSIR